MPVGERLFILYVTYQQLYTTAIRNGTEDFPTYVCTRLVIFVVS